MRSCLPLCFSDWESHEADVLVFFILFFFILQPCAVVSHSASMTGTHMKQMYKYFLFFISNCKIMRRRLPLCFHDWDSHEADV